STKAGLGEKALEIVVAHRHIALGIGFLRILLGLNHDPSRIVGKSLEHAGEVDAAVAGHGVDALENGIEEGPVFRFGLGGDVFANVLGVDVADPAGVGLRHANGVAARPGDVAGVEQQLYRGAGPGHEAVDLVRRLND